MAPIRMPQSIPAIIFPLVFCITNAAEMPAKFAMYAPERSIPPEIIQILQPSAISPISDTCRAIV